MFQDKFKTMLMRKLGGKQRVYKVYYGRCKSGEYLTMYRYGKEKLDFKHSWMETFYGKQQNKTSR